MSVRRKKVLGGLATLVVVCLGGSFVLYQLLMPVPLSVLRQIDEDLSTRLRVTRIHTDSSGIFAQLFQTNSEPYSYEIVEVVPINLEGVGYNPDGERRLLCVLVEVNYKTSGRTITLSRGRSIPETFYYIAYELDGDWDVFYMLKPSPNCD